MERLWWIWKGWRWRRAYGMEKREVKQAVGYKEEV
jgi:hypothetical protein